MFLHIDDRLKLEDIQERFNDCFPCLQIAFYAKPHKRFQPAEKEDLLDGKTWVADVRKRHVNAPFEIKSWFTVERVERDLKELFDLNTQIFRMSPAGEWIETTLSDSLTLQEQSELAMERSISA